MKKIFSFLILSLVVVSAWAKEYKYETVPNDPLKVRIYTLDNGLKVYLSAYHDEPRIQAFVTVKVGGKNDPAETTGLAHYFEHLMFKGTANFGTSDYSKEKPLLDQIEHLFEVYRTTTDEQQRKLIYRQIDSVSGVAAHYAIPNEYDKLMTAIGSTGTNAWTSTDATNYIENIPSNQLENWAKIQFDRFSNPVIRIFHTELETVYEEKNMSLTNDGRKVYEALLSTLFPHHPYGTQTVLGTQEHLKNPSITNIKNYFETYYAPNNMAVIMSGDFEFDKAIEVIDQYFGKLKSKPVPALHLAKEEPIIVPVERTVYGPDAENIAIGFRFGGADSPDADMLKLLDMVLMNGKAGLLDLNIVQKQRLLGASSSVMELVDYNALILGATPKQGQTLDDAKAILMEQLDNLKQGKFDEWLLKAVITDFKRMTIESTESNNARAYAMLGSFVDGVAWKDEVEEIDRLSKITKEELVKFANERLGEGYVVIYKRTGKDTSEVKIDKPEITPIQMNRDAESEFLATVKASNVTPIEPVFLDFQKDLSVLKTKKSGLEMLYKQNIDNTLFDLLYVFNMGANNDKELAMAVSYLKYLGTDKYTAEQLKEEFYKLGCAFNVVSSAERVYVNLSGLNDNMEKSLQLFEHILANAKVNTEAYQNLVGDLLKSRGNAKLNQRANFSMLTAYGTYGEFSPATNILSEKDLTNLDPQKMVDKIHELTSYKHRIFYYGPMKSADAIALMDKYHKVPKTLKDVPAEAKYVEQPTTANKVLFANYEAKQIYLTMMSKLGSYDKAMVPIATLYNEYFGGGMNAIVFQEMREARGLAYSANASYALPGRLDRSTYMRTFIATQTDKMGDAVDAFNSIINDMPESLPAFKLAQNGIIQRMRTERITKSSVLWAYDAAQKLGLNYDIRRDIFTKVPTFTLTDVKNFQQSNVKNLPYTYCILGDENTVDLDKMATFGTIEKVTQEQIFGY